MCFTEYNYFDLVSNCFSIIDFIFVSYFSALFVISMAMVLYGIGKVLHKNGYAN